MDYNDIPKDQMAKFLGIDLETLAADTAERVQYYRHYWEEMRKRYESGLNDGKELKTDK